MPPRFLEKELEFAPGEVVPEHDDIDPMLAGESALRASMFTVQECTDRLSGDCKIIADEVPDQATAEQLAEARRRRIATTQEIVNRHLRNHVAVFEPEY